MDLGLRGRSFILTGASRGLGFATARTLVDEGARVTLVARTSKTLAEAADSLGDGNVITVVGDLADEAITEAAVTAAMEAFGRLDGALVSAGSPSPGTVMSASDDAWRLAFDTVFLGGLRMARAVVENASASDGPAGTGASVVMVLSSSARSPIPGLVHSNGLRPGLAMLVKELADEVGPEGIRVNGMLPGRIDTDNVREQDARRGDPAEVRTRHESAIPLRRYGQPEEFGRLATFLLSPAASYVNGSLFAVDGGMMRAL